MARTRSPSSPATSGPMTRFRSSPRAPSAAGSTTPRVAATTAAAIPSSPTVAGADTTDTAAAGALIAGPAAGASLRSAIRPLALPQAAHDDGAGNTTSAGDQRPATPGTDLAALSNAIQLMVTTVARLEARMAGMEAASVAPVARRRHQGRPEQRCRARPGDEKTEARTSAHYERWRGRL